MTELKETQLQSVVHRMALKLDEYDLFDTDLEARLLRNELKAVEEDSEKSDIPENSHCILLVN